MSFSLETLKNSNTSRLFYGQLISQACDKMMTVGLVWVFTQQFSASVIPWFLGVCALPHLLLSLRSGRWVSSLGPLKTIVWADILRGILFMILAMVWSQVPASAYLLTLFAFSFVSNLAGALFNPAILSLPVFLPEKHLLQEMTALNDSCFSFGNILGPLLSALLYPWFGLKGLFLFNGASYLFAAAMEAGIVLSPQVSAEKEPGQGGKPKSMGRLLKDDSLLTFILGGFLAINLFLAPLLVFLPLFAKSAYFGTIGTLASLETALACGAALGGTILSVFKFRAGIGKKITIGIVVVAVFYLAFALTTAAWAGCACLFILGMAQTMVNIFSINLVQSRPAARDVPMVMSLVNLIGVASMPLSMAVVGLLVMRFDARSLALSFGCILLVVTILVASNRELQNQ